jgi:thymidylate synthase
MKTTNDIRLELLHKYCAKEFVNGTIECTAVQFEVTDNSLFKEPDQKYLQAEFEWYLSKSLNINDMPIAPPKIWQNIADMNGIINSNYGWCVFSKENGSQTNHVLNELRCHPDSRRAVMVYNRPSMHIDAFENGRNDWICTMHVQYLIRNQKLHALVYMRSNDAIFGYTYDVHWQKYVQKLLAAELGIEVGPIIWHAGSFHVYERHFHLLK